jgi:hypothetical protein
MGEIIVIKDDIDVSARKLRIAIQRYITHTLESTSIIKSKKHHPTLQSLIK